MSWASIVGQTLAVRLLRQAIAAGKMAHAYLFVGPEGVGKRMVALEMAKALNCQTQGTDGACDACPSCRRIAAVPPIHPDLALVQPDGRFIKTDQIRELQTTMYSRPNEGNVRIALIDGADRMNAEAGNRLLKLLEEPPDYAVLILLASNLSGVLPTLISRCQVVHFPPLSSDDVARGLRAQTGFDERQTRLFASLSGGSIGRAVRLAQDPELAERREATGSLLQKLPDLDDLELLSQAELMEKQKEHLEDWLELLTVWLRDGLLVATTGVDTLVINQDKPGLVDWLARNFGPERLLAMLAELTEARGYLQRNANTRLVLDVLLLRLGGLARAT